MIVNLKNLPDKISIEQARELFKKIPINKKGRLDMTNILPEYAEKIIEPILNKKIKGATKVIQDGIKFDSQLERYMYNALNNAKIPFTFKETIHLIEGFEWHNHKVRNITWTPDFFIPYLKLIIDTKGYSNDTAPIKIKLCKRWLFLQGNIDWQIWIIKKKSEITHAIEQLKVYKTNDKSIFEV